MRTILYPEWLIDGTGAPARTKQSVVIEGPHIDFVGPADQVTPRDGDQVIDLHGSTLLPGLINNHVHLVLPGDNTPFAMVQLETDAALSLRAAHNTRESLRAGVTTVRDCGGRGAIVVEVRDAQAKGLVSGSRVFATAWPVTITGGHERYFGGEADGAYELTRLVRRIVSSGADFIKVLASGGGTPGSLSQYPSFSVPELKAIVEAAHPLGRLVAAHCIATASLSNAIEAGVDLIEHALFMDADGSTKYDPRVAERLAESGIPVATTMQVARDLVDLGPDAPDYDRWLRSHETDREIKAKLRGLGVTLLAGSDAGWRATTFSTFWKELDELVAVGMSPTEAIHSATQASAKALGQDALYGAIEPGLLADLLVVGGDASTDIRCLTDVSAVFLAGTLVAPITTSVSTA